MFNNCGKSSDELVPNDPAANVAIRANIKEYYIYIFEKEDIGYVTGEVHLIAAVEDQITNAEAEWEIWDG